MKIYHKKLETFFLPDLCNVRAVLVLILLSEAFVTALILIESGLAGFQWERFATVSYFVQWVALLSVALLCQSRTFMARLALPWAVCWAMSLLMLVCFFISLAVETILPFLGIGYQINWSWIVGNILISAIFGGMGLRYFYVQSQWRLKSQAELNSRLQALQARIRPHFFFNSLNTVASLIAIDADKAETMLVDLSSLFRVVLKDQDAQVDIAAEIELGRRYLNIEQHRLGDRLKLEWQLPDQLPNIQVPQLLLQPLLENAIYHGIQPLIDGGKVVIKLSVGEEKNDKERRWFLSIENNKPELAVAKSGHQISLSNITMRLEAVFADAAALSFVETANQYRVMIELPEYNDK
ncbi:MAG: two-component system sensor histidine kinase AlgZ [Oleispira sp.]|jgi:two-component system sensor histidine kinase AlgZ